MKYLKTLGLCLVAALALSVAMAATASAAELELVNTKGEALVKKGFSGESGKGTLETVAGRKITCSKAKFSGTITGTKSGEATTTFTGCEALGIFKCNSEKAKEGEIITTLSIIPVWEVKSGTLERALLLTILPSTRVVVILCGGGLQTLDVRHGLLILLTVPAIGVLSRENTIEAKQTKGVQAATKYEINSGEAEKADFLETEGSGFETFGFEQSGEETEAIKVKFEEEVKLREN